MVVRRRAMKYTIMPSFRKLTKPTASSSRLDDDVTTKCNLCVRDAWAHTFGNSDGHHANECVIELMGLLVTKRCGDTQQE